MVEAMIAELEMRKNYLPGTTLSTLYFGGGTPSLLTAHELNQLFEGISRHFTIAEGAEITLEANPDDLDQQTIQNLQAAGVNRLSIGVQTFDDDMLAYLNRAHTSAEAERAVKSTQDAGIENISLDLIYALPAENHERLRRDIDKIKSLGASHLSAYCLTIEQGTAFGNWVSANKMAPVQEDFAAAQFELTVAEFSNGGYAQYEISNFALGDRYSRHNTAYWQRKSYLGIGPSAHSYNGVSREFNLSHNPKYLEAIKSGISAATVEVLSQEDMVNEYLLTGLRTKWGCDLQQLDALSAGTFGELHRSTVKELVARGWLQVLENNLILTQSGKLFADRIASDLFIG